MTLDEHKESFLQQWKELRSIQRKGYIVLVGINLKQLPEEFRHDMWIFINRLRVEMIEETVDEDLFNFHRHMMLESIQ